MKTILIIMISLCAGLHASAGELGKALLKAANEVPGSDGWYTALTPYVQRNATNELGKMTNRGFVAVREEVGELKKRILDQTPPLDIKTELDLAEKEIASDSIRDLCKFLSRWSRVAVLIGRLESDGKVKDAMLRFKCDLLEVFVEQHGVRAFMPKEKWETQHSAGDVLKAAPEE